MDRKSEKRRIRWRESRGAKGAARVGEVESGEGATRAIRGIEVAMHVQTQYILIDVLPGGSWITTVPGIFIYILAISRALVEPPEVYE